MNVCPELHRIEHARIAGSAAEWSIVDAVLQSIPGSEYSPPVAELLGVLLFKLEAPIAPEARVERPNLRGAGEAGLRGRSQVV